MKNNFFYQKQDEESSGSNNFVYFLAGIILLAMGIFLILQNTMVSSSFTLVDLIGFTPPFGLVMLPLLIGIGVLFFNGKSILGWILIIVGVVIILLGILMGLRIMFKPTTMFNAILMFGLTAAGTGLFLKAFIDKRK